MQTRANTPDVQPPADIHRPRYHFLPRANWINDPNGLILWQGVYHLFYQYNPHGALWGQIHWGHASSVDLVNWRYHPIALAPGPEAYDRDGCWSGCAVNDGGAFRLIYTGCADEREASWRETVCLATADATLDTFEKSPANPLLARPPEGVDVTGFRDPFVWREDDQWRMVIGSGFRGIGGAALLYSSPDLLQWTYSGPLCVGDLASGEMWECPNLVAVDGRHALILSPLPQTVVMAALGDYADGHFTPTEWRRVDGGKAFYAPQVMRGADAVPILMGWLKEERSDEAQVAAGWSGAMSLPRRLRVAGGSILGAEPIAALASLRANERTAEYTLAPADWLALPTNAQGQWEVELEVEQASGTLTFELEEGDATRAAMTVDLANHRASLRAPSDETTWLPFLPPADGWLRIRVFFDHSILECFVQGQACLTKRVYPQALDALRLLVSASDAADAPRLRVRAWDMRDAAFTDGAQPQP